MAYFKNKKPKTFGSTIYVEEGRFEKALRQFKKKVEESGLLKEMRDRQQYEKPSVKRKLAKNAARKRWQKKLASQQLPPKHY
jgi:small subunit ribosomal protein S21